MAGRKYFNYLIALIITSSTIACNTDKNNQPGNDTGKASSGVDSMPVVNPPVKDSSSILVTPPVNDSNVVKPDTTNSK